MTTRYYLGNGPPERLVRLEGGIAWVWRAGEWHERGHGGDADSREITADEAERFIAERSRRFTWTEEDLESGGVYFHRGPPGARDEEP